MLMRARRDLTMAEAARGEEIDRAPKVTTFAKADRRRAPAARAEVSLVEQEDGEARRQRRGERE